MKSILLELELSDRTKPSVVVIPSENRMKFMSEVPLKYRKNEKPSTSYTFETDKNIINPVGYAFDRINRMVEFNPNIKAIIIDNTRYEMTDSYITPTNLEEIHFINGYPLSDGEKVVVSVLSVEGHSLHEYKRSYSDIVSGNLPPLQHKKIVIPVKKDENGNPRFTRNLKINEILFKSGIGHCDALKEFTECLNNNKTQVVSLAKLAKDRGMKSINGDMLLELIGSVKVKKSTPVDAYEYALCTKKSEHKDVEFSVDDLIGLLS
ncbi:hypothetical protein QTV49_005069 [Vibrio vulnificus]|nr:hypothetical protein [Vibrio vulnificus]